jgi:perosamine synthetase
MLGLIPRDYWEHKLIDLFYALTRAFGHKENVDRIYIDGLGSCLPVRSGRAGLVVAIKALNLQQGSRIGVPLYCCPVVFQAITTAGCTPCFVDIEPESFCLSAKDLLIKRSEIDAVLAVHMFGNLCDIRAIQKVVLDIPIIEDCAQSLGSKLNGCMAGSFGKISFLSFRSGKYLSVGEGGAMFSKDPDICSRISRLIETMPTPSVTDECVHRAKTYIKSILRSKPLYGIIGYALWRFVNSKMNLQERSGITLSQIYKTDSAIIKKRLSLLNSLINRRRKNADFFSNTLKLDPNMLCLEKPETFYNRYYYPVTFPSKEVRDFMADYLLKHRIDTIKYIDEVVDIARKEYGYNGDCPMSESLSQRVLIIPNYHSLKEREVEKIAQCFNDGWSEWNG